MANPSAPDYKALLDEALKQLRRAEEERQYEAALRTQAEEQQQRAEEERQHEAALRTQAEELTRNTTFDEYQADVYNIVRRYLQPASASAPRLFSSLIALEDLGRSLCQRPISSEKDLEGVERYGKDRHVHDIVSELCKIPRLARSFD
ncbi:hypothetical protein LTR08_005109 [Meristemomyces frigidus]|nr:hypothetical protein LTR08_005109 [Meristemomyces frigidus]